MMFNIMIEYQGDQGYQGYNTEGGLLLVIFEILRNPKAFIKISRWPKKRK